MRGDCSGADIVIEVPRPGSMLRDPRMLIALGLLLVAVLVLVVALALGGSTGTPPAAARAQRSAPLESIFEADAQLEADPAATLDLFRRLGVARVRLFVPWGALGARLPIAPDPLSRRRPRFDAANPAAYPASGWAVYDAIDRAAAARRIGLDFSLGPPAPVWATARGAPPGPTGVWKVSAADFGQFVHALGTRYSGHYPDPLNPGKKLPRVGFWALWNEPNLGIELAPQAIDRGTLEVSPVLYRGLLDAAWSALKATGHGGDTILIGELAPRGSTVGPVPGDFDMMVPLRFLRALYCVDASYNQLRGPAAAARGCPTTAAGSARFVASHPALFHASGFADHPYPQGQPPTVVTPDEPDYADFAALPKLQSTLDRLQQVYGSDTRFPIYSTEFGYETNPPEKLIRAISAGTAAQYMNWAEYLSWRNPRIRSYDQYLLMDSPSGMFATGLEYANGARKATYDAYRMPLFLPVSSARRGRPTEVWGCVRPAHYALIGSKRSQHVEIQFKPDRATKGFHTVSSVPLSDADCYFDVRQAFPSSGSVRLKWSYPGGPAIFSRTARVDVR
jgi:hypothetical protein